MLGMKKYCEKRRKLAYTTVDIVTPYKDEFMIFLNNVINR